MSGAHSPHSRPLLLIMSSTLPELPVPNSSSWVVRLSCSMQERQSTAGTGARPLLPSRNRITTDTLTFSPGFTRQRSQSIVHSSSSLAGGVTSSRRDGSQVGPLALPSSDGLWAPATPKDAPRRSPPQQQDSAPI